jgi:hypothetical protein
LLVVLEMTILPNSVWYVDYEDLLRDVSDCSVAEKAEYLLEQLPFFWRDCYLAFCSKDGEILIIDQAPLWYQFDLRDDAVPGDGPVPAEAVAQEPRLVAAFGYSQAPGKGRPSSSSKEMRGFVGPTRKYFGQGYDKGHFIAHSLGGEVNINLFPQLSHINQGLSEEGRIFRAMEQYCEVRPATMLFSRPLYLNHTGRPSELEFGLLRDDGTLWVNLFPNSLPV